MKALFILGFLLVSSSVYAGDTVRATALKIDFRGERPTCQMLAWRWVKTLSSMEEGRSAMKEYLQTQKFENLKAVTKRIPEGMPEGLTEKIQEVVTFKVKGVRESNFRFASLRSASIAWENAAPNMPEYFKILVKDGEVLLTVETNYVDYCFYGKDSKLDIEVNGRPVSLTWSTKSVNLARYLELVR